MDERPRARNSRRGRGSVPSGFHRRDRMLTPKRNGPSGDSFSEISPRNTDERAGASRRKPLSQILRAERERKNITLPDVARLIHIPLNDLQLLEGGGDGRLVPDPMYLISTLR